MIPMHNIAALESRSVQSRETRFNFRFSDTTEGNSVNPQMSAKAYQMKDDIRHQNNIGIYTNPQMMSLPCDTVHEANGFQHLGNSQPFDKSLVTASPISWNSDLAFVPDRYGFSANFKQTPLTLHTFKR